ncbi:MAG: hypothetical protein R2861_10495 [Desulfobacterales bacterium]
MKFVGGNAMVEMGTFVAILLGLVAGNLINPITYSPVWMGAGVCMIAIFGWTASLLFPSRTVTGY